MRFYLYRDNYVIKVGEGDSQLETKLRSQGYELSGYASPSREEAESQRRLWQNEIDRKREMGLI